MKTALNTIHSGTGKKYECNYAKRHVNQNIILYVFFISFILLRLILCLQLQRGAKQHVINCTISVTTGSGLLKK